MFLELVTSILQMVSNNKIIVLVIITMIAMLLYVNRDRMIKSDILRKAYKEEFDSFDIQAYKNYVKAGDFISPPADANVMDYIPTKTSKLVTNCDEKREECITN